MEDGGREGKDIVWAYHTLSFLSKCRAGLCEIQLLVLIPWGLSKQGSRPGVKQQVCAGSVCLSTSASVSSQPEGRGHVEVAAGSMLPLPPPTGVPGKDGQGTEGEMPRQARLVTLGRSGSLMERDPGPCSEARVIDHQSCLSDEHRSATLRGGLAITVMCGLINRGLLAELGRI